MPGHLQDHGSLGAGALLDQATQRVEVEEGGEDYHTRRALEVQEDSSRPGTEGLEVAGGVLEALMEPSGVAGLADLAVVEGEPNLVRLAHPVS